MNPKERKPIPLSETEKQSPLAKFYREQLAEPNPVPMAKLLAGPMDPSKAITPEEAPALMLKPGYMEVETGYCTMESGAGYLAVNNVFPGCTIEMMQWWFAWHALEGLRYKIWNPYCHPTIAISDEHRRYIMDPKVPLEKKSQNVIHFVVEDIGAGQQDIVIHFLSHEEQGYREADLQAAKATVFGGYGLVENRVGETGKLPVIMMHYCREIPDGVEFRTRFWMGYRYINGRPVRVLPEGVRVPQEVPMGLALHNVEEFSHLASILPEIYREYGKLPIA